MPLPVRLVGPPAMATAVAFEPGGNLLATGYRNGMIHIWKPRDHDQNVGVQPLDGQIEALAWGPTTTGPLMLAAATAAGSLAVWMIDHRTSTRASGPQQLRRGPTGELPTLYLHKLR
jgi:WD40 repeat protein